MFINVLGLIRSHLWHLTKPSEAFQHFPALRVWLLDRYEGHASFIAHSQLLESPINENRSKSSTVFTSKQSSGSIECSYQTLKKLQNSCPKSEEYPHPEKPCTVYTSSTRNPNLHAVKKHWGRFQHTISWEGASLDLVGIQVFPTSVSIGVRSHLRSISECTE